MVTFNTFLSFVILLKTAGVDGQYPVQPVYSPQFVCALKGSSVKISCTHKHFLDDVIKEVFWTKTAIEMPGFCFGRVQCHSENKYTHSFTVTNVTESDKNIYYCSVVTSTCAIMKGIPGAQLDVTDLQVETQQRVKEGDSVTLTCKTTCTLTEGTTFIWYRNEQRLTKGRFTLNKFHMQSVSRHDSGLYRCAIRGYEHLSSSPYNLNIRCLQSQHHEVTHVISKICVVRQSTALIPCRYSHPQSERLHTGEWLYQRSPVFLDPVFKGRVEFTPSVGDDGGNCSLLLRDVRDSDAGVFHFAFRTDVTAQNWTNLSGISLEVTGAELEVISPPDVVTEGDLLVFICGSCIPSIVVPTYIWRKDGQVFRKDYGSNQLDLDPVRLEDEGRFSCTLSGHEGLNSSSVTINVRTGYSPKNTSAISPSGEKVEGDLVTYVNVVAVGVILAVVVTSIILMVAMVMFIRRKKRTSEGQNSTGQQQHNRKIKSSDDTYMTLEPKSMCSDYDTLDNLRISRENEEP